MQAGGRSQTDREPGIRRITICVCQGSAVLKFFLTATVQERRQVIEQMQALAGDRDMRVTILSCGTGAAAVTQFYR